MKLQINLPIQFKTGKSTCPFISNLPIDLPIHNQKEEKINTNLQELGMNLSRSQYKTTLMLTIPRSNQVVYKGFPSAILIVSIRLRRRSTFQSTDALPTQGMIQSDCSLFEKLFTQQTKHFVGFQPGFRLRGVQPLSHA
jgi:hypothetical protein